MKLRYADPAREDLENIFSYIEADNPAAARRVILDLMKAAAVLKAAPFAGRPGRVPGTREWAVRRRPYVLVYRVEPESDLLTILAVYHVARRRP